MLREPINMTLTPPSLKNMSYARMALLLWSAENFRAVVNAMKNTEKYHEMTKELENIISALPLPCHCKAFLKDFLYVIWGNINTWTSTHRKYWKSNHESLHPFTSAIFSHLVWTPSGQVNAERSAWNLVNENTLEVTFRYRISCVYFMEEDIRQIWKIMTPQDFYGFCPSEIERNEDKLVTYWTFIMMNQGAELGCSWTMVAT